MRSSIGFFIGGLDDEARRGELLTTYIHHVTWLISNHALHSYYLTETNWKFS